MMLLHWESPVLFVSLATTLSYLLNLWFSTIGLDLYPLDLSLVSLPFCFESNLSPAAKYLWNLLTIVYRHLPECPKASPWILVSKQTSALLRSHLLLSAQMYFNHSANSQYLPWYLHYETFCQFVSYKVVLILITWKSSGNILVHHFHY
jgi:hypothetical protein